MASKRSLLSLPQEIIREGWLSKKSPHGIKGFRSWQKRWVTIDVKSIKYYGKPGQTKEKGHISIEDVIEAEYLPDKRTGARFDVRAKNLRTYHFDAMSVSDAGEVAWRVMPLLLSLVICHVLSLRGCLGSSLEITLHRPLRKTFATL